MRILVKWFCVTMVFISFPITLFEKIIEAIGKYFETLGATINEPKRNFLSIRELFRGIF